MKKNTWVVVADEAIARILAGPSDTGELDSVEEITDPDAHAKALSSAMTRKVAGPAAPPTAQGSKAGHASPGRPPSPARQVKTTATRKPSALPGGWPIAWLKHGSKNASTT